MKDLIQFIEDVISRDSAGFRDDEQFGGKWWLLFSGDRGGGGGGQHMKYHIEVLNSGSVDNVHIYCMFEAADSVENMMKVWYPYRDQIREMMKDDFTLKDGNSVLIFLGGDYYFLDDNMGYQGLSASYPSSLDKVALTHLQNHGNLPHTPKACLADLRSITGYLENYNENHYSVVGPMLFPLRDLDQVVPATLHVMLGIVLLLYNLLLDQCRKMDFEEGFVTVEEQKEVIRKLGNRFSGSSKT